MLLFDIMFEIGGVNIAVLVVVVVVCGGLGVGFHCLCFLMLAGWLIKLLILLLL